MCPLPYVIGFKCAVSVTGPYPHTTAAVLGLQDRNYFYTYHFFTIHRLDTTINKNIFQMLGYCEHTVYALTQYVAQSALHTEIAWYCCTYLNYYNRSPVLISMQLFWYTNIIGLKELTIHTFPTMTDLIVCTVNWINLICSLCVFSLTHILYATHNQLII